MGKARELRNPDLFREDLKPLNEIANEATGESGIQWSDGDGICNIQKTPFGNNPSPLTSVLLEVKRADEEQEVMGVNRNGVPINAQHRIVKLHTAQGSRINELGFMQENIGLIAFGESANPETWESLHIFRSGKVWKVSREGNKQQMLRLIRWAWERES